MRLLFLSNLYPPYDMGGLEQWCQEITVLLRQRGHRVHVLTSRHGLERGQPKEEDVTRSLYLEADVYHYKPLDFFLNRPYQEQWNRQELRRVLDIVQPDLVCVWGMWNLSHNLPCWAEQWLPDRVAYFFAGYWPIDPDVHTAYWQLPARRGISEALKRPLRALALAQLRPEGYPPPLRFEHASCCSRYVRNTLVWAGKLPESAGVLYGGIDPEPFMRQVRPSRRLAEEPLRLLYFGGLVAHKGVHTALEAVGSLKQRGLLERVDLTVLGGGHPEYEARLKSLAVELRIAEKVRFAGRVPRSEIPDWLAKFDVFLFTTISPEPMARTVMEAMAAGLAVIGSEVGGQVEMLADGENSLTFQPGDAEGLARQIQRLLDEPELHPRLAEAGKKLVLERFTLARMANDIETWLRGLIA